MRNRSWRLMQFLICILTLYIAYYIFLLYSIFLYFIILWFALCFWGQTIVLAIYSNLCILCSSTFYSLPFVSCWGIYIVDFGNLYALFSRIQQSSQVKEDRKWVKSVIHNDISTAALFFLPSLHRGKNSST